VYLFAYSRKDKAPMPFVMLVYFCLFFNTTLNIMRQSMAVGFILISLIFLEKKAYKKTILFFIIAELFHTTAVLAIPIYLVMIFENMNFSKKIKTIVYVVFFLMIAICVLEYANILKMMVYTFNIFPEKYYGYLSDSRLVYEKLDINKGKLAIYAWTLCMYLCLYKKQEDKEKVYFILFLINIFLFPLTFKLKNASRIGIYYTWPAFFVIYSNMIKTVWSFKKENNVKNNVIVACRSNSLNICINIFLVLEFCALQCFCNISV
jgi:hypothetical protein